ncbi:hypothetical protein ACWDBD_46905 [Streptomyces sp. NPDC001118]
MTDADNFPATLDRWDPEDWQEYRDRVANGEGSVRAIDAITRRRVRKTRQEADR